MRTGSDRAPSSPLIQIKPARPRHPTFTARCSSGSKKYLRMDQDVSSKHVADLRSRREETRFVAMLLALAGAYNWGGTCGGRDRRGSVADGRSVFGADVWTLIYLEPSSNWHLKSVTGRCLNMESRPGDRAVNGGAE
jgi:hypothetical protein